MKRFFFLPLLLSGCFSMSPDAPIAQTLSPKRQKQKIIALQRKLDIAEKEQRKAQTVVETLSSEIEEAKLALIRRQIDDYERKRGVGSELFLEEREALYQMIQEGPSESSFAAQMELDRILRLITERS